MLICFVETIESFVRAAVKPRPGTKASTPTYAEHNRQKTKNRARSFILSKGVGISALALSCGRRHAAVDSCNRAATLICLPATRRVAGRRTIPWLCVDERERGARVGLCASANGRGQKAYASFWWWGGDNRRQFLVKRTRRCGEKGDNVFAACRTQHQARGLLILTRGGQDNGELQASSSFSFEYYSCSRFSARDCTRDGDQYIAKRSRGSTIFIFIIVIIACSVSTTTCNNTERSNGAASSRFSAASQSAGAGVTGGGVGSRGGCGNNNGND